MNGIKLRDRVRVIGKNCKGEVAYVGETHFSPGTWIGVVLDEPKGRHNGTVDGHCYFQCPKPHGVFLRPFQLDKETHEDSENGEKAPSKRIVYPNYLSSGSKLKFEKHTCAGKVTDPTGRENRKSPVASERSYCSQASGRDKDLQKLLFENRSLKSKLKTTESTLNDTLQKHAELLEEVKNLKTDLESKTKQVQVQKCHLKLLKMRQCNHYMSLSKSNAQSSSTARERLAGSDATLSEDEFDLESLKVLSSMERVVELEEQNRIMIEGLLELREFLKAQAANAQGSRGQPRHRNSSRPADKKGVQQQQRPNPPENLSLDIDPDAQLRDYKDMLHEMTRYTKAMKDKSKVRSIPKKQKPRSLLTTKDGGTDKDEGDALVNPFSMKASDKAQTLGDLSSISPYSGELLDHEDSVQHAVNEYHNAVVPKRDELRAVDNGPYPVSDDSDTHGQALRENIGPFRELRQMLGSVQQKDHHLIHQPGRCRSDASMIEQGLILKEMIDPGSSLVSIKSRSKTEMPLADSQLSGSEDRATSSYEQSVPRDQYLFPMPPGGDSPMSP